MTEYSTLLSTEGVAAQNRPTKEGGITAVVALSDINGAPSLPPLRSLHHLCVMCVYKMLIERHSCSLAWVG